MRMHIVHRKKRVHCVCPSAHWREEVFNALE